MRLVWRLDIAAKAEVTGIKIQGNIDRFITIL